MRDIGAEENEKRKTFTEQERRRARIQDSVQGKCQEGWGGYLRSAQNLKAKRPIYLLTPTRLPQRHCRSAQEARV
jgi:hypothetical protein